MNWEGGVMNYKFFYTGNSIINSVAEPNVDRAKSIFRNDRDMIKNTVYVKIIELPDCFRRCLQREF
jgi:hypothetical protein